MLSTMYLGGIACLCEDTEKQGTTQLPKMEGAAGPAKLAFARRGRNARREGWGQQEN